MGHVNLQRLADLGQLPKNFIANKLWQKNQDVMKEQIKTLTEENNQLRAELEKYSVVKETVPVMGGIRPNNDKEEDDSKFKKVNILE